MEIEEENKNKSKKRCFGCFAYQCYYTKGYMRFTREKLGFCIYINKVVGHKETCELWRSNQSNRRRLSVISIKALNDTIAELIEVTNIIKEDIENKNLSLLEQEAFKKNWI